MSAITGALFQDLDISQKESAQLTIDLTERASDLASVFNTDVNDAMSAISQAVRGETEAIRRYAGDVTDATLQNFLFAQGVDKNVTELTQQEKKLLRTQVLLEQTASVQGDFAKTSGDLANRQRILSARIENVSAKF